MKKSSVLLFTGFFIAVPALADNMNSRVEASRDAVKEFQVALQSELQSAMKAGGPVNAIDVCNIKAAAIADDISREKGWKIGRTSLKVRSLRNVPDVWETQVLKDFAKHRAAGEDSAKLERFEVVKHDGKSEFRYMKAIAIPEGAPCLACHGEKVDPAVAAKLKKFYPQDQATGFRTGDLRGAFTIRQPL